ncbi:fimbrial biogenesis chaperone [Chromobacterium rhizoryzae]|uniref:fimbrial biogenesis chaperone n=1 Tax=Chromobacterium rhizoryzae TaxID=1778675 RepID=UPI001D05CC2B|nr:molecular chaperone [Chromobacterium rhizoryzae]
MSSSAWARWSAGGLLCLLCGSSWAGLMAESTRVVFEAGGAEQSLQLVNLNPYPVVVQAWVDDGHLESGPDAAGAAGAAVMPIPPIFRLNPKGQISLRLLATGVPLPVDRESLFWLNLYEIPPTRTDLPADAQTLTVTLRTQMKVLMRPAKLPVSVEDLPEQLRFTLEQRTDGPRLRIDNASPYYATFRALELACARGPAQPLAAEMVAPLTAETLALDSSPPCAVEQAEVRFLLVGDDGNPVAGKAALASSVSGS